MNSDTAFPADGVSVEMLTGPDFAGSAATPQQDVWPEGRAGAEEGEAGPDPGREGGQEEGEGGARHPDCRQGLPIFPHHSRRIIAVLRIRDPVPFWPRDPGWVKKSGSEMNNPDHISGSLETIIWIKILKFFDADPGSGMEKIWICHPG